MTESRAALARAICDEAHGPGKCVALDAHVYAAENLRQRLAERGVRLVPTGFVESVAATSNDPHLVIEAERILSGEATA